MEVKVYGKTKCGEGGRSHPMSGQQECEGEEGGCMPTGGQSVDALNRVPFYCASVGTFQLRIRATGS